ncbi:hypothetical protein Q7P37_000075 [Cladosporium fusiforme]
MERSAYRQERPKKRFAADPKGHRSLIPLNPASMQVSFEAQDVISAASPLSSSSRLKHGKVSTAMNSDTYQNNPEGKLGYDQVNGYIDLAQFLARDVDNETYVFRKFERLAARNILYLQGELIKLERDAHELDEEAKDSMDPEVHLSMRCWADLDRNARDPSREHERRIKELADNIERKLRKYYETLMLQRDIAMLESPSPRVLTALREWMHPSPRSPESLPNLDGRDGDMFKDKHDLVALRPPSDKDVLSRMLRNHWPLPSERLSSRNSDPFRHFEERHLTWVVTSVSVTIAAILLTLPIVVLYFVTNPNARLGLVITFIVLFALGLSLSTGANRDSIFGATAAYAAVLVVFVSGNLANSG